MRWSGIFLVLTITLSSFTIMLPAGAVAADGERIDEFTTRIIDRNGNVVYRELVPGSPPPAVLTQAASLPGPDRQAGNVLLTAVPSSTWAYGCSATAAAMLAGYYDQPARGYTNIYNGPANGGVFPLNNEAYWGHADYLATCGSAVECGNNPLSATKNGVDGRAARGSVDDYWQAYNCTGDAYSGRWTEHTADSLADFMGTSQWVKYGAGYENPDGGTSFWYAAGNDPLYDYTGTEPLSRDGCHGIKLFLESRGYAVTTNYNQRIYGFNGFNAGFTYAQYKAEIDAGRPVIIQLYGHTVLGVGYNDTGNTIYIHDTWDNSSHSMTWGGAYYGRQHRGVTVVQLAPTGPAGITVTIPPPPAPPLPPAPPPPNPLIGAGGPASHGSSVTGTAATAQPVSLPNIQVQSASLSAGTVTPGRPVTVTAGIANKSTVNGSKKVTLYVNGQVETVQGVSVNSGGTSTVTFKVSRGEPGDYTVYVDSVPAGSFKVEMAAGNDAILIFSAALLAMAFLLGIIMLRRRQQRLY
jgi:hypothetical protein